MLTFRESSVNVERESPLYQAGSDFVRALLEPESGPLDLKHLMVTVEERKLHLNCAKSACHAIRVTFHRVNAIPRVEHAQGIDTYSELTVDWEKFPREVLDALRREFEASKQNEFQS